LKADERRLHARFSPFADLLGLGDHCGMKNFNIPTQIANRHPLAAACVALLSSLALTACVVTPPESVPAPGSTGPVATMKGPTLGAPIGSSSPARPSTATGPVTTTSLMRDIALEIGDAMCDTDSQCHTVGVGAKACGGPEGYVAWSSKVNGAGTGLKALAAAHSAERERENERSGMRSNCSVTPDPGAVCRPSARDGLRTCQTVQNRPSGAV
jgi:hypothetical protein